MGRFDSSCPLRWRWIPVLGLVVATAHCAAPASDTHGGLGTFEQASQASYFPPPESQGGWRTLVTRNESPDDAEKAEILARTGIDWDLLDAAWQSIDEHGGALLVIRYGWIAGEWGSASSYHIASCTKSLTGLALAKLFDMSDAGALATAVGPDDFAYLHLPSSWGSDEPARQNIRIRHLLTMSSGLEPHDQPTPDPAYLDTVLSRSVEAPPETVWAYASAPVDLLSLVVEEVTSTTLKSFFEQQIGEPIGVPPIAWQTFDGHTMASAYSEFSARNLARIAYLTLREGDWDGTPILSAARVATFTQWASFLSSTTFREPNNFATDPESQLRYGYLWWTNRTSSSYVGSGVPADAYYMAGYATNVAVVMPSLDLIVVRLGTDPRPWSDGLVQDLLTGVLAAVVADVPDGGAGGAGGSSSTGGAAGMAGHGGAGTGANAAGPGSETDDEAGCGCRIGRSGVARWWWALLALLAVALCSRRDLRGP